MPRRVASPAFGLAILALCCCSLATPTTAVGNGSLIAAGNGSCTACQAFNWTQPGRVVLDDIAARRQVCLQSPLAPSKVCTQPPIVQPTCNGLPCNATTDGVPPICFNSTGQGFCNTTTNSTSTNGTSTNSTASAAASASQGRHLLQLGTEIPYVNPSGAVDGNYYVQVGNHMSTLGNTDGTNFAMYDKCEQGVFVTNITFFTEDWTGALIGMLWHYSDNTWVASPGIGLDYQAACVAGSPSLEPYNDPVPDKCRYATVQTGILGGNTITGLTIVMGGADNVPYPRYTDLSPSGYINFPISSVTITINTGSSAVSQTFGHTPTDENHPGPTYTYPDQGSLGSGILCGFTGMVSPYQEIHATPPVTGTPSTLAQGDNLQPNQQLLSESGLCWVRYQSDNNIVVYNWHGAVWSSKTNGGGNGQAGLMYLGSDGNLCIEDSSGDIFWCLGTDNVFGHGPTYSLVIQDDCNLAIYSNDGNPDVGAVWASGTQGMNMPPFGFLLQLSWVFLQTITSANLVDVTFVTPSAISYAMKNQPSYKLGTAISIPTTTPPEEPGSGQCGFTETLTYTTETTLTSELATTITKTASIELEMDIKVPLLESFSIKGTYSPAWSQTKTSTTAVATSTANSLTMANYVNLPSGTWKCVYVWYNSVLTIPWSGTMNVVLINGINLALAVSGTYNSTSTGVDNVPQPYGEVLLCPNALYGASAYCVPQNIAFPSNWTKPPAKDRRRLHAAHHPPPCPKSSPPPHHHSPPPHHASPPPSPYTPTLLDICYTAYVPPLLATLTDVANMTGTDLGRLAQINPFIRNVTKPLGNTRVLLDSCHNGTVV